MMKELNEHEWLHIFTAGEWPGKMPVSAEDIKAMADDYDPDFRVATVGIGHPSFFGSEEPAHGTIAALRAVGANLYAKFKNLSKELKDSFKKGRLVNWSVEFLPNKYSETKRHYLIGLAFLGRSQPAVPAMATRYTFGIGDGEPVSEDYTFHIDQSQPLTEGVVAMANEATVSKTDFEALDTKVTVLSTQLTSFENKFNELSTQVKDALTKLGVVEQVVEEHKQLQTAYAQLADQQAKHAAEEACRGIPKGIVPDKKREYLIGLYKTNREMFDVEAESLKHLRDKFSYLTEEVVAGEGQPTEFTSREGYVDKADEVSNRRAVRAFEILAEEKVDRNAPDYADRLAAAQDRAYREVKQ